jgi:hypothetical protein
MMVYRNLRNHLKRQKSDKWTKAAGSTCNLQTKPLLGDRNQLCSEENDLMLENKPESVSDEAQSKTVLTEAGKDDMPVSGKGACSAVKRKKVYGKFEYTPTGEHILRCLVSKCSQTFDTKMAAELHNAVHPGLGSAPDVVGSGDVLTYFQCNVCDFRAPYYHWYDLLRHMSNKHGLRMQDKSYSFTCEYCGLGFDSEEKLALHVDFHYSNRYKCVYCGLLLLTWSQVDLLLLLFLVVVWTHYLCNCFKVVVKTQLISIYLSIVFNVLYKALVEKSLSAATLPWYVLSLFKIEML